ncbi:hypothetical protein [Azovibrio restrictus]|uniref:hypothetical protein n=1 Tax=Azovibrio restrictus TaxID=146938 RepID=UPI001FE0778E|nr:hypothetical protein [Azovibrio restrictus]MCE1172918.1 hypothetical protein [Azovibrio sp.]
MHRSLLVAYQNMLYLILLEKFVIDVQDGTAGIPENMFHLFFLQAPDYNFCAGNHHGYAHSAGCLKTRNVNRPPTIGQGVTAKPQ